MVTAPATAAGGGAEAVPGTGSLAPRGPRGYAREVLVKICGLTNREDAEMAVAAGADLVGFVLVPGTRRYVDPAGARWIREIRGAERVGVFRGATLEELLEIRERLGLHRVQLHGGEPPGWCAGLGAGTIRAVRVAAAVDWGEVTAVAAAGCLPLLDPGGGSGRAFDWRLLREAPGDLRFGLAGGLRPENVGEAVRLARPVLVDVSSGVERRTGRKDPARMEAFVRAARAAAGN